MVTEPREVAPSAPLEAAFAAVASMTGTGAIASHLLIRAALGISNDGSSRRLAQER
jgi:hypothetical protein